MNIRWLRHRPFSTIMVSAVSNGFRLWASVNTLSHCFGCDTLWCLSFQLFAFGSKTYIIWLRSSCNSGRSSARSLGEAIHSVTSSRTSSRKYTINFSQNNSIRDSTIWRSPSVVKAAESTNPSSRRLSHQPHFPTSSNYQSFLSTRIRPARKGLIILTKISASWAEARQLW